MSSVIAKQASAAQPIHFKEVVKRRIDEYYAHICELGKGKCEMKDNNYYTKWIEVMELDEAFEWDLYQHPRYDEVADWMNWWLNAVGEPPAWWSALSEASEADEDPK